MMIVTYDEHGGFFDHVLPLPIPAVVAGHAIATTGVRVPALVVSPQVAAGSVFTGALDHTSILQLFDDKFSPGAGYSVAVNARQAFLNRLENILVDPPANPRAPAIPPDVVATVKAAAAAAVIPPAIGASPADPQNAQAMHGVALKAQALHPELIADPAWTQVSDYLAATTDGPDV
jgi:phospholipase C